MKNDKQSLSFMAIVVDCCLMVIWGVDVVVEHVQHV